MAKNKQSQSKSRKKVDLQELDSLRTLDAEHSRIIAVSAGDFRLAVAREVERIRNEHRGNLLKAAEIGTRRLYESTLITAQELEGLNEILQLIFAAQLGKADPDEASAKVRAIYSQMLANTTASPVALAIASIASSGPIETPSDGTGVPKGAVAKTATRQDKIGAGAICGAITGGIVGGLTGGVGGAIGGAIIGAVAGGWFGTWKP